MNAINLASSVADQNTAQSNMTLQPDTWQKPVSAQFSALPFSRRPRRWPYFVLGGVLLLAAIVGGFGWHDQQIIAAPANRVPVRVAPVANQLVGYVDEVIDGVGIDDNTLAGIALPLAEKAAVNEVVLQPAIEPEILPSVKFDKHSGASNLQLQLAWLAYQRGDWALAEQYYQQILSREPRQYDALLGMAALHLRRNEVAQAAEIYQYLLQLNPHDNAVSATLQALQKDSIPDASSDPQQLGAYYAKSERWSEAQAQFFTAWQAQPDRADLAYNLAVSLDHLQQSALAAEFYQKALDLATHSAASFDRAASQHRLQQLQASTQEQVALPERMQ